jgi:hemoglobin-like flavoprotein
MILGAQHATIAGFDVIYFSIFAKCLHLTWEKVLGEEYTEDMKDAWTGLFEFIMERIRDGYVLFNQDEQNKKC